MWSLSTAKPDHAATACRTSLWLLGLHVARQLSAGLPVSLPSVHADSMLRWLAEQNSVLLCAA